MFQGSQYFKKRPGTTDLGKDYEDQVVASLALKLSTDPQVHQFCIASNQKDFGSFDDIVLEFQTEDGLDQKYALQLKHVANEDKGSLLRKLTSAKGPFSIKKYFEDYAQLKNSLESFKLVLFTNHNFSPCDNAKPIRIADENFDLAIVPSKALKYLSEDGTCFKFEVIKGLAEDYQKFFDNFFLCVGQLNVFDTKQRTLATFKRMFECENDTSGELYMNFVTQWSKLEGRKAKLTKDYTRKVITLQLLSPFLRPVLFTSTAIGDKLSVIKDLVMSFNVSLVGSGFSDQIRKIWSSSNEELEDTAELKKLAVDYQIGWDLASNETRTKLLWLLGSVPLIVPESNSTYHAINLSQNEKYVVIGENLQRRKIRTAIFENLCDLDKTSCIYQKITQIFKFTFQGKERSDLQILISGSKKVEALFGMNQLLQMSEDSLKIGGEAEALPEAYVTRHLGRSNGWIAESELLNLHNSKKIEAICGDPGMGKSTIVKSLKNNYSEAAWKIMVCPKEHSTYFQSSNQKIEDCLEYLLSNTYNTSFDDTLAKVLLQEGRLVLFWDGLDEIPTKEFEVVTSLIKKISEKGLKQFVTGRCHLMKPLETKLGIVCRLIKPLDNWQQQSYVRNQLRCPQHRMEEVVGKIWDYVQMVRDSDFLGIPLQVSMLVELFNRDWEKYVSLSRNIFSITKLYEYSVDEKLKICWKKFNSTPLFVDTFKKYYLDSFEKVALMLFFDADVLAALQIDCDEFLDKIEEENFINGLITGITQTRKPNFVHQSFAEYFAAKFLAKHYRRVPNFAKIMFEERLKNVRFMLDLLLAEGSLPHLAVLYKNHAALKKLGSETACLDLGGRTPLHLASSWGQQYPLPHITKKRNLWKRKVYRIYTNFEAAKNHHHHQIVKFLLETCNPYQVDLLYEIDALSYADKSFNLFSIATIAEKHTIKFRNLNNFRDIPTLCYYSVRFGFSKLFTQIKKIPSVETNNDRTLLHLAAYYNRTIILEHLLSFKKQKHHLNQLDSDGQTPLFLAFSEGKISAAKLLLQNGTDFSIAMWSGETALHMASYNGHCGVVKLLLENGANVKTVDENGRTPIHEACLKGYLQIVKLLLKHGADVNVADGSGRTPLHAAACSKQSNKIVRLLLEHGADVTAVDNNGRTSADLAFKFGYYDVVNLLVVNRAPVSC